MTTVVLLVLGLITIIMMVSVLHLQERPSSPYLFPAKQNLG